MFLGDCKRASFTIWAVHERLEEKGRPAAGLSNAYDVINKVNVINESSISQKMAVEIHRFAELETGSGYFDGAKGRIARSRRGESLGSGTRLVAKYV